MKGVKVMKRLYRIASVGLVLCLLLTAPVCRAYDLAEQTFQELEQMILQTTTGKDDMELVGEILRRQIDTVSTSDFSGGSGSQADPYRISSVDDLKTLARDVNDNRNSYYQKYFLLTKNIEFIKQEHGKWMPIGWSNPNNNDHAVFSGVFDGNGKTITNLYIDSGAAFQGLFGILSRAEVKNLTLINCDITGSNNVGGIAGLTENQSSVVNCFVVGAITATAGNAGGITGALVQSDVKDSEVNADVFGKTASGGIAGYCYDSATIENCNTDGSISGATRVGGIAGTMMVNSSITQCVQNAEVIAAGSRAGGIAGELYGESQIKDCAAIGDVSGATMVGGIAGSVDLGGEVNTCQIIGAVYGDGDIGEVVGIVSDSVIQDCVVITETGADAGDQTDSVTINE